MGTVRRCSFYLKEGGPKQFTSLTFAVNAQCRWRCCNSRMWSIRGFSWIPPFPASLTIPAWIVFSLLIRWANSINVIPAEAGIQWRSKRRIYW